MGTQTPETEKSGPLHQIQPGHWPPPRGYANGIMGHGTFIVLGGQIGWDETGKFAEGFVGQARQALSNIAILLQEAGAGPEHLARLTWYVTDIDAYRNNLPELGRAYREALGRNFPAMALVQVVSLVEREAMVEIEATAILPDA